MLRTTTFAACALLAALLGCGGAKEKAPEAKGEHVAVHGGCLNALGTCENGHVEAKVEGETLTLWFVGGGGDTAKAVRVPDAEIALAVTLDGEKDARTLALKAKPNALADEKAGDGSRFEGSAPWLKGAAKFVATGRVTFKGKPQDVRIEYPAGYDPD